MTCLEWFDAIGLILPHVVEISTPSGSGTGFLLIKRDQNMLCGIATAAHVVNHAYLWKEPIRIQNHESGEVVLLKDHERALFVKDELDVAAVIFLNQVLSFPDTPMRITPEGKYLKTGNEIGWVGFPALAPNTPCFFSGRISSSLNKPAAYLVDGVAINGVSGGPAFTRDDDGQLTIIGLVSAYIPNRATGEPLPGLCLLSDVRHLQSVLEHFDSLEEAKDEELYSKSDVEEDKHDDESSS